MQMSDSLDPADWPAFRGQAHALLDTLLDHVQHAAEGPVWRPVPDAVKARLAQPSPDQPTDVAALCGEIGELILPYGTGNIHPRFWGWVHGSGTPGGILAEMTAATLNANCGGRDHVAIYVERTVIGWARQWFGLPETTGGVLVGGTSVANMLGIAVARHHRVGDALRTQGLAGRRLVAYASTQAHMSMAKAFEVLGLGRESLRAIPVDGDYRMDLVALAQAIAADRAAGLDPFCVVASVGTVNCGAIDDLEGVAALCREQDLWFHVDGAFGSLAILAPDLAPRLAGIEQADSLAFDFHKWLHVPYDAGCILVRDGALQRAAFGGRPDYLATMGGLSGGDPWPCDLGIDLSRGFRALKVWFTLREHGTARLGAAISRNCAQAVELARCLASRPPIEVVAPVGLNIVCCRYRPPGVDGERLDRLNAALVIRLQESGVAVPSTCRLQGRLAIRICITNHRSRDDDFALLVDAIERTGAALAAEIG
jgi:glutamate/tyrosine decarboxylase-like PLP-dependent enzyme